MVLSPDEVIATLVLVVPGFIAVTLARQGWGTSRTLDNFSLTVWSIFLSAAIDFLFFFVAGLPLLPSTGQLVGTMETPYSFLLYSLVTIVVGVIGAFTLRFEVAGYLRQLVWFGAGTKMIPTLLWDDVLTAWLDQPVVVETDDGRVIQGRLIRLSTWDEPRELALNDPREVVYDDKGQPAYYTMGASIYIPGRFIKTVRHILESAEVDGGKTSKVEVWGHYRGWGPALLVAGGSLFLGWIFFGRQGIPPPSILFDVVFLTLSVVLMGTGALLVYQAQREWGSQKGSENAPP